MRFSILAIATTFALVSAQDLSGVPSCALPCFAAAVPASGCSLTDTKCQCTTGRESITNSLLTCTPSRCSAQDLASIAPAVQTLCAAVGVTVSNVPTASAASSAVSGTASGSQTRSVTDSSATAASTNAATAQVVGYGAVAMGLVAVLGL